MKIRPEVAGTQTICHLVLAVLFIWVGTGSGCSSGGDGRERGDAARSGDSLPSVDLPATPREVPRGGVFELTLRASRDDPNPYLLLPVDAESPGFVVGTFDGPSGRRLRIDGFWDGGRIWRVRICPDVEGVWSYRTVSPDSGLDDRSGSFTCTSSESRGFVEVDSLHPHHFRWADGTPLYWAPVALKVSCFGQGDAEGGRERVDDGTFQALARERSAQGFNAVHWGYYGFSKPDFRGRKQQNEGGPPFHDYDPDRLNPAYHQYGDRRIEALLAEGIIPQLTLGWPDQEIAERIGHERLKRYWRYLIARYAAYNITYNLFGEAQEFGDNYLEIVAEYADLTRCSDPYHHLLSTHTEGDLDPVFVRQPWLDYLLLQRPPPATSDYLAYAKPIVNAEYGGYEEFQVDGEALRPLIWEVRMRGGYFVYESWGNQIDSPGARYAMHAHAFFRDRTAFWLLEACPELFDGHPGLADPGREYVLYLPQGGEAQVDLSAARGEVWVEWFDPRTGEAVDRPARGGGQTEVFRPPFEGDAVLHLTVP